VVGRAIDEWLQDLWNAEIAIVNRYRPDIDTDVQKKIGELVHWKEKDIEVVGHALEKPVDWVERMACEWRRHLPLVVWLVQTTVEDAMVQPTMDPVDATVREQDERNNGECYHEPTFS